MVKCVASNDFTRPNPDFAPGGGGGGGGGGVSHVTMIGALETSGRKYMTSQTTRGPSQK